MASRVGKFGLSALCLLWFSAPALAEDECRFYTYKAEITDVYDGDTVTANIDLGFHTWRHGEKLRLYGIDTPELAARAGHPLADGEKERAIKARDALRSLILHKEVVLCTIKDKQGKFGRYLVKITTMDGLDVNEWLVSKGYAKPYMREAASLN